MSTQTLRVGILGTGFGATVHAPAFHAHPAFEVRALCSPNNAARIAAERGIPHAFSDLEEMLENCELDVLSIASPPFTHAPAAHAAFARGLHVLCEKPFALSVEEAAELVELEKNAPSVGALCHEFRFLHTRRAMHELRVNRHLGALRRIEISKAGAFLRAEAEKPNSWWFERARGGGITGAWMSHAIDMAVWLAGAEPLASLGFERTANPRRRDARAEFASDVADGAFALLRFEGGLVAQLAVDGTAPVDAFVCALHGEDRTAVASGSSIFTETLYVVDRDETAELEVKPMAHAHLSAASPLLPSFVAMLDAFHARILGRASDVATFADGLRTQRILAKLGYDLGGAR